MQLVLAEMSSDTTVGIFTLLGTFLGAIIGGLVTYFVNLKQIKDQLKRDEKSIASLLYAEIKTGLEIIEFRGYLKDLKAIVCELRLNPNQKSTFEVNFGDEHTKVYNNNLEKISLLRPDLQTKIVSLYQMFESAILDVKPGGVLTYPCGPEPFEELAELFEKMTNVGKEITSELNDEYELGHVLNSHNAPKMN